jgi:hypothetical protein
MGVIQALIIVVVLIVAAWAVREILSRGPKKRAGPCVPAISNILLPAGRTSATIACCEGPDGECLGGYTSSYGTVALIPTTLTPSCPVQLLRPGQYAGALPSPVGNAPMTVDTAQLGRLYTAGTSCGDIQIAITRLCYPEGGGQASEMPSDPAACSGGIAVAQGAAPRTVACPGGLVLPTRRTLIPSDFSLATCQAACCYADLPTGGLVPSITIDAKSDAGATSPCAGHTLDELLFYQCAPPPAS